MIPLLLLSAWAGPTAVSEADAKAAAATCGADFRAEPAQSFRLGAEGKAWNQHALVPTLDDHGVCLVHLAPEAESTALAVPFPTCMNCSPDAIAAIGFQDVNADGVPDVSLAVSGTVGWDPQSEERFVGGTVFYVWTASADWTELKPLDPDGRMAKPGVDTLPALWKALAAERAEAPAKE